MCWLCLLGATAWAQDTAAPVVTADAAEFQRIEATRARETAAMDAQEAACYQRCAVSSCLTEVQSRRRAMLANLRQQEAVLHEREFAERGAEQRRLSQQKVLERQQKEEELRASHAEAERADKLQAQKDKQAEHAAKAQQPQAPSAGAATPQPTGPTAAEQAAKRDSYARKLADAEKKRQEIAKRLADKAGKGAAPLPVPN